MMAVDHNQAIQASGGVAPFAWSVSSGSLPHNLSLESGSTNIANASGKPDTAQGGSGIKEVCGAPTLLRQRHLADNRDCNEIVMIARSERINTEQNGSNRRIWKPLKRVVE
jgi:hypothetical protein